MYVYASPFVAPIDCGPCYPSHIPIPLLPCGVVVALLPLSARAKRFELLLPFSCGAGCSLCCDLLSLMDERPLCRVWVWPYSWCSLGIGRSGCELEGLLVRGFVGLIERLNEGSGITPPRLLPVLVTGRFWC